MGFGLILSGIGKGISDAGTTYGAGVGRAAEMEWKQQEEDRSYERKLQLEEKRQEALKQRVISEIQQVNSKADEISKARTDKQLDTDAEKIAAVTPSMDKDSVKQLMQDNPAYVEAHRKNGVIGSAMTANQQRLQAADDKVQAALSIGAHSSVVDTLEKSKKDVLDQIREENREKKDDRRYEIEVAREDRRDRESRDRADYESRMAGAAERRAAAAEKAAGRTTADPNAKPVTTADLQRQITAAQNSMATELGVAKNDVNAEVASLKRKADAGNPKAKERLEAIQPFLDEYNDANRRMLDFKRSSKPSGNTGDNSGSSGKVKNYSNLWN